MHPQKAEVQVLYRQRDAFQGILSLITFTLLLLYFPNESNVSENEEVKVWIRGNTEGRREIKACSTNTRQECKSIALLVYYVPFCLLM